jgi:hypothetical protein
MAATGEDRPGLYVTLEQLHASAHVSFACTTCHSALDATMHAKKDAALASCARCHPKQAELFADGAHAGSPLGVDITCVTCHGNHSVRPAGTPAFHAAMTERCSSCHNEMGERFFGGNPFGMQTHLGRTDVATCWDCHRAHLVEHVSDPRSPVSRANILSTCRRCHTNAPPNFAGIAVHVASSPLPDDPRLRAATLYMLLILVGTFGFFGYHTALQIRHELRRRAERRGHPPIGGVL